MLKALTYTSLEPGPRLLIFGAIHGNEKCGAAGINRVAAELDAGKLQLAKGRLQMIPICNPRAYIEDVRYVERNLNRYLVPMEKPDTYEARIGNILCPLLEKCDALLDIHSYTVGGEPFISYTGGCEGERAFAAALGVRNLLTGWEEVYAKMGKGRGGPPTEESTGGPQYARRHGAIAVTIECGQHKDSKAPEIAYQSILNALRHFGMLEGPKAAQPKLAEVRNVQMTHVYYRDEGGKLPRNWKHLEEVKAGEVIASYPYGKSISAPENGFIIMPKADCPVGEEWFYFGVQKAA